MAKRKKKKISLDTYDYVLYKKNLKKLLTDNKAVNVILSPIYFAAIFAILYFHYKEIPVYIGWNHLSMVHLALGSTFIYVYSSYFYQPDLDQKMFRPSKDHFPFGIWITKYYFGRFLKWLFFPINRIWYYMWQPYADLFTHRGVSHFPIISTMLRALILMVYFYILKYLLHFMGFHFKFLMYLEYWLKNFFLKGSFFSFWILNFPIYISDLAHIVVDYYDSVMRGISFCPPKIQRGYIYRVYKTIMGGDEL